ncbi:hypothetical protein OJ998_00950 [Solirubrobacter taibaiensis]|nr:hypothetical protein [Solirubrobacter taibaiensis]
MSLEPTPTNEDRRATTKPASRTSRREHRFVFPRVSETGVRPAQNSDPAW